MNSHEDSGSPKESECRTDQSDLVICRCEEVAVSEIEAAIGEGYLTMDAIKRATRAGMGPCQGRTCGRLVRQMLVRATAQPAAAFPPPTVRPPLRPCKLSILAADQTAPGGKPEIGSGQEAE